MDSGKSSGTGGLAAAFLGSDVLDLLGDEALTGIESIKYRDVSVTACLLPHLCGGKFHPGYDHLALFAFLLPFLDAVLDMLPYGRGEVLVKPPLAQLKLELVLAAPWSATKARYAIPS